MKASIETSTRVKPKRTKPKQIQFLKYSQLLVIVLANTVFSSSCTTGASKKDIEASKRAVEEHNRQALIYREKKRQKDEQTMRLATELDSILEKASGDISKSRYNQAMGSLLSGLMKLRKEVTIQNETINLRSEPPIYEREKSIRTLITTLAKKGKIKTLVSEEAKKFGIRGNTKMKMGDAESALEEYERSLLIAPYWDKAYYNLGATYEKLGIYDKAIDNFNFFVMATKDKNEAAIVKTHIYELEVLNEESAILRKLEGTWQSYTSEKPGHQKYMEAYHAKYEANSRTLVFTSDGVGRKEIRIRKSDKDHMKGIFTHQSFTDKNCQVPGYTTPVTLTNLDSINGKVLFQYTHEIFWINWSGDNCTKVAPHRKEIINLHMRKIPVF